MKELREQLIDMAHAKGICSDGFKHMLQSTDTDALIEYYLANPDWCLERDFPNLSFLREHFADIGNKGIFVDKEFNGELLNDKQVYIFHHCKGTVKVGLNVEKEIIPMLYFANDCQMLIVEDEKDIVHPIKVPMYSFGQNALMGKANSHIEFLVFKNNVDQYD